LGQVNTAGVLPWSAFSWIDQQEHVPELVWPNSVTTYNQMRTDSQVNGLYLGITLPIRRYNWVIKPNGARDEIVAGIAEDFNLPIQGDDEKPSGRVRDRFSWGEWLRQALLSLAFGHYWFEMVGTIKNNQWRLRDLAPRPPATVTQVNVGADGDLVSIKQAIGPNSPEIPASRLVPLSWDKEGGNWFGRSIFRPMYKDWLIKDRLVRVDALKHERNGLGVPTFEASPGASRATIQRLEDQAQAFRAGDMTGVSVPSGTKFSLVGTSGTIPDTIASLQYHDEAMARSLLMMVLQLGQTKTGSRALGETFVDWFSLAQESIAIWIEDQASMYAIEDWVNWNYGEDEPSPRIGHERNPEPDLAVADLVAMVAQGIVSVDPELEAFIRGEYLLPEKPEEEATAPPEKQQEPTVPVPAPPQLPAGTPMPSLPVSVQSSQTLTDRTGHHINASENGSDPAAVSESPVTPIQGRRKRTEAAAVGLASLLPLPSRTLRRQPYTQEVAASVDYAQMDQDYKTARDQLVAEVSRAQEKQVTEIGENIIAADGDLGKLADLSVTPIHADTILPRLVQMAQTGAYQVINEAKRQGVSVAMPNMDSTLKSLQARATATDSLLARSLAEAAGRKAIQMTGPKLTSPADVADFVKEYLSQLSNSYLTDQLGGAVMQAMNAGRKAVMDDGPAASFYSSELLDDATCENCVSIDGTEYPDLDAAEADYPTGGYMDCLGGPRCRGTLVAVYGEAETA
jgi:hypothetical protein